MKPMIIAGNGPSLALIDYSRLPKEFDVYRCNQFYLEDRYFLGKKVKGAFFNQPIFKEQFFTLQALQERKEYEVLETYCSGFDSLIIFEAVDGLKAWKTFSQVYPNTFFVGEFFQKLPQFQELYNFCVSSYGKQPTTTICMLVVAIAQGYKEIYLTGLDFYVGGGRDYAFKIDKSQKNLLKVVRSYGDKNFKNDVHSKEVDAKFIKLAMQIEDIKLYSLSQSSPLCELVPLAPLQEPSPMEALSKPEGFICDLVAAPTKKIKFKKRFRNFLVEKNLMDKIEKNIFLIFLRDLIFILEFPYYFFRFLKSIIKK